MAPILPTTPAEIKFWAKFSEIIDDSFWNVNTEWGAKDLSNFQYTVNNMKVTQVNFALTMLYDKLNWVDKTYKFDDEDKSFDRLYDTISWLTDDQAKCLINKLLEHGSQNKFQVEVWKWEVVTNLKAESVPLQAAA